MIGKRIFWVSSFDEFSTGIVTKETKKMYKVSEATDYREQIRKEEVKTFFDALNIYRNNEVRRFNNATERYKRAIGSVENYRALYEKTEGNSI